MSKKKQAEKFKYEPYSDEWNEAARSLALCYAPEIIACKDCGAPVVKGYCCTHCGSIEPR